MQFTDSAIVLSIRKFTEHGGIVRVLTANHGVFAGVDRFAFSSKKRGVWQPGNRVEITWRARLPEQMGSMNAELVESVAAHALDDRMKLSLLQSACQLTDMILHERELHPEVYEPLLNILQILTDCHPELVSGSTGQRAKTERVEPWMLRQAQHDRLIISYILFEFTLLNASGFGLDLERCAATGRVEDLAYVSPKTGRAVSREAGEPYKDRLLRLPEFLLSGDKQKTPPPPAGEEIKPLPPEGRVGEGVCEALLRHG